MFLLTMGTGGMRAVVDAGIKDDKSITSGLGNRINGKQKLLLIFSVIAIIIMNLSDDENSSTS